MVSCVSDSDQFRIWISGSKRISVSSGWICFRKRPWSIDSGSCRGLSINFRVAFRIRISRSCIVSYWARFVHFWIRFQFRWARFPASDQLFVNKLVIELTSHRSPLIGSPEERFRPFWVCEWRLLDLSKHRGILLRLDLWSGFRAIKLVISGSSRDEIMLRWWCQ